MKTMQTLVSGLTMATLGLVSTFAHADKFGEISGNIGIASEYVFRGLPSSGNGAQVSGGLDWSKDNYYAGTWISNVGNDALGNEVDFYAGATFGDFDIGAIAYLFPADANLRNSKLLEIYGGYSHGPFSGYVWYGAGAYSDTADDYIYVEGNVSAPVSDKAELSFHLGYTIFHGDDYGNNSPGATDDQTDLGITLSMGDFWVGVTSILDNDTNNGANKRPRINLGYSWSFDDVVDLNFRSMK